mmetsp:Transcript_5855/g.15239  ORF Transcript_5855/g.15239 Transcript_5855/m.15239 type:complete len:215 (+) Transcript_5855:1471-2115(+)
MRTFTAASLTSLRSSRLCAPKPTAVGRSASRVRNASFLVMNTTCLSLCSASFFRFRLSRRYFSSMVTASSPASESRGLASKRWLTFPSHDDVGGMAVSRRHMTCSVPVSSLSPCGASTSCSGTALAAVEVAAAVAASLRWMVTSAFGLGLSALRSDGSTSMRTRPTTAVPSLPFSAAAAQPCVTNRGTFTSHTGRTAFVVSSVSEAALLDMTVW